ncbi:MAG: thiamine-phosphate kinase, partial [Chitinophagaceae bacterium]
TSQKGLIINITAIGACNEEYILRNTMQAGDLICVTGDLGAPFIGFAFLEREKKIFLEHPNIQPNLENQSFVIGKFLKPEFPKEILIWLKEQHIIPTAMTDISNGLSMDIICLCQQSKKGCMIYEDKLPIEEDTRLAAYTFKIDPTMCVLSGGEEYQLLFTISPKDYENIKSNTDIRTIGYITNQQNQYTITTKAQKIYPLQELNVDSKD